MGVGVGGGWVWVGGEEGRWSGRSWKFLPFFLFGEAGREEKRGRGGEEEEGGREEREGEEREERVGEERRGREEGVGGVWGVWGVGVGRRRWWRGGERGMRK